LIINRASPILRIFATRSARPIAREKVGLGGLGHFGPTGGVSAAAASRATFEPDDFLASVTPLRAVVLRAILSEN
jgi:hypothetical protein